MVPCQTDIDLPTALNQTTCIRRGFCPIIRQRGAPRKIYFELHGSEDATYKMVFKMCLGNTCFSWSRQVEYFSRKPNHAVLVFDNRGVGYSDAGPLEPYKTSEMAKDLVDLLDHLCWDNQRSLHVIGVSLGGMIAQELCFLIPKRIMSVVFTSTKARNLHIPGINVLSQISLLALTQATQTERVATLVRIMFPAPYLDAPAPNPTPEIPTNRAHEEACMGAHHKVMRHQTMSMEVGQTLAALFHSCSTKSLGRMAEMLEPAKVLILTGDADEMMAVEKSVELHRDIPGSELVVWSGGGHALCAQMEKDHNLLIERVMQEGEKAMVDAGLEA
ncbi:hypothetical protein CROQUDRAFT_665908 [Cronartium quercuum f. sp. fusiforme G11]|uniref:AB hydrolase-1 domain-containing protein n=1 Tax=Cronartium quercuum f. sp. fusiforme G11 TaxID=708437 RepID=A0A9P6N9N8_9BASI|nr:hypothetical protein CROQUDRAFT_665908 [Cronartium quercuum f. sp. fusiforme G11]